MGQAGFEPKLVFVARAGVDRTGIAADYSADSDRDQHEPERQHDDLAERTGRHTHRYGYGYDERRIGIRRFVHGGGETATVMFMPLCPATT